MSRDSKDSRALAETLVAYGKRKGATEVEVTITEGSEFGVEVLDQNIESLQESGTRDLNLRVLVDGRTATASSSDFSEETLQRLVTNAVARARLSGKDPYAGLPETRPQAVKAEALNIYDPAIPPMPPEAKIAFARQIEAVGIGDKRIKKSTGASCGTWTGRRTLVNSKGFAGAYGKTLVWYGGAFQAGEGENLFQDGWYDGATSLGALMDPESLAKKAVGRVVRLVGARKVETQNVPVVFEPPMTAQILGFLGRCLGGPSVDRRQSFLVGRIGEKVGNERVNVVDDATLAGGRGTWPFDDEGVPAARTAVLEKGVLKSYLLDTYYGKKLGMKSTGNSSGPTNLYWAAGDKTPEQIIASVDRGLLLTGTLGQGTVPTTGDISVGAFGLWIEKGEVAFPVAEITISGNLGEMLGKVEMVGSDLEFRRAVTGPTVKFAEMTVGGTSPAKA
jgi:PmbA protein